MGRRLLAAVALIAAGALTTTTTAGAEGNNATTSAARGHGGAQIVMRGSTDASLKFSGPAKVKKGTKLTIVNKTNPNAVGPHTFTLIKKGALPTSNREMKACFASGICGKVAVAHQFDPMSGTVAKQVVKSGKKGWDKSFSRKKKGDSWFTAQKDEKYGSKVTAKAGTKLTFFCAVHPWMAGTIKVTK